MKKFFSGIAAVAVLLGAGMAANSVYADSKESGNAVDEVSEKLGGKVSDILEDTEKYVGKTVTISNGEIDEVVSDRGFVLESGALGMGAGLLVVGAKPFPGAAAMPGGAFQKDNDVKVTGVVRIFNGVDIEKEIGWPLEDRWKTAYEKKPVLVATEVVLIEKE